MHDLAFSKNGEHIVTTGADRQVKIWSNTGTLEHSMQPDTGGISCVVFSNDHQTVLSGSWSGKIYLNEISGPTFHSFQAHEGYTAAVVYSHDNQQILSGGQDGKAKVKMVLCKSDNSKEDIELTQGQSHIIKLDGLPSFDKLLKPLIPTWPRCAHYLESVGARI